MLDVAMEAGGASKGNVQVFDPLLNGLEIIAQRGFDQRFLQTFRVVQIDMPSICARALRFKRRVMVSDVRDDLLFWPYLSIAEEAGFCAVQSTPILAKNGSVKGVFSTHFAQPHRFTRRTTEVLDDCAEKMAEMMTENLLTRF